MTYRYLRIAIAATVVALVAGVAIESTRIGLLNSISAYYYTDARNIFVASLIACSLGMLVLSEPGPQRTLRAIGALFAPLVALIPTTTSSGSVPGLEFVCPGGARLCVPEPFETEVTVGIGTYLIVAAAGWVTALVLRLRRPAADRTSGATLVVAALVIAAVAAVDLLAHDWLVFWGHGLAALAFFGVFAALAVVNAVQRTPPVARAARIVYVLVALGMVGAVVAVLVIGIVSAETGESIPILGAELTELGLFFTFWVLQTVDGAGRKAETA
ncbi:MAG: hypothetical protein J7480_00180 [Microbacteriaceae bacterium]|nr:hypothetical protein [Microbacteriaceae bacterium]